MRNTKSLISCFGCVNVKYEVLTVFRRNALKVEFIFVIVFTDLNTAEIKFEVFKTHPEGPICRVDDMVNLLFGFLCPTR